MRPSSEPPRQLPDRAVRDALSRPANLRSFLRQVVPALAEGFDFNRLRPVERAFALPDWRYRESDLAFEIPFRLDPDERWALAYVLLEHQSAEDPAMPLRLLIFVVLYWERQWRAWEQGPAPRPPLRLRPVLPLVLYTGSGPWHNSRTLHDLLDEPAEFHGFVPEWGPLFWDLSAHSADELLASGGEWQKTLAVLRSEDAGEPEFTRVFTEAVQGLRSLGNREPIRWSELMRIVLSWGMWRRPRTERQALIALAQQAQTDVNRRQEIGLMGQTIAEEIWEEGRLTGELRATRSTLQKVLIARFGPLPEDVVQRIERCTDLDRLMSNFDQLPSLSSLDDLHL